METTDQYLSSNCGKIFEKIIFNNLTENQSGIRPGDSTTNQLIDLVDEIHQAFDSKKPLEVHAVFPNISNASDTCECNLGVENILHFLFECPFYAIHRVTLAVNVIDILQRKNLSHLVNQPELYLYGHPSLDLIDNRPIILSTINYVKDTMRFSTSVT